MGALSNDLLVVTILLYVFAMLSLGVYGVMRATCCSC